MTTDFRALCNAWWDDNFSTDYIIDRNGNYKSQADCIEDLMIRAHAIPTPENTDD